MSLVVVGSVAFDALETPFGRVARTLGGAATYFSVAASFFTPVRLVGIVGDDFTARDAAVFKGRSISLEGLERAPGKSFFWAGRYSDDLNHRDTLVTELNVFANFQPKLPPSYRDSQFLFLANIDPTLQRSVLTQMRRRPKLVALDTMNYWIERTPVELRKTLRLIDVLVINDTETKQLAGDKNLLKAAHKVMKMGPRTLVVKRGEYGAVLLTRKSIFSVPGYPLREPHDPTGAGDAFAGGLMGAIAASGKINGRSLRRAMVYGSVLGSFTVEEMGLDRLRCLTRREIDSRAREFARLTQFQL